jgi:hypothetical protein
LKRKAPFHGFDCTRRANAIGDEHRLLVLKNVDELADVIPDASARSSTSIDKSGHSVLEPALTGEADLHCRFA